MSFTVACQSRVLIALATYDKGDNLASSVREIHADVPAAEVLVVDDNSPVGTGGVADAPKARDPRIHLLHRPGKLRLGTAVLAAMRYPIEHKYEFLVTTDADFSHHPRYLLQLIAGMKRYDLMIGSRYIAGGETRNWPLARKVVSRGVNVAVWLLMRIPARRTSGEYRWYNVCQLRRADWNSSLSYGYSFEEEVRLRCHRAGCSIGETPIVFENPPCGRVQGWSHGNRSFGPGHWEDVAAGNRQVLSG